MMLHEHDLRDIVDAYDSNAVDPIRHAMCLPVSSLEIYQDLQLRQRLQAFDNWPDLSVDLESTGSQM